VKILLTGAAGYIGSYLEGGILKNPEISLDSLDLRNGRNYRDLDTSPYDVILHLAAHSSVAQSVADPAGTWENNVVGYRNLVINLMPHQILINASSGSVYGSAQGSSEEHSGFTTPANSYDLSKMIGDLIALDSISAGKRIISLRFGTIAGASPNMRWDLIVNKMFLDAIEKQVIHVVNPNVRRGILFLPDLENALKKILLNPIPGIYNLVSINTTVGEVANVIADRYNAERLESISDSASQYDFHLNSNLFIETFGEYRSMDLLGVLTGLERRLEL